MEKELIKDEFIVLSSPFSQAGLLYMITNQHSKNCHPYTHNCYNNENVNYLIGKNGLVCNKCNSKQDSIIISKSLLKFYEEEYSKMLIEGFKENENSTVEYNRSVKSLLYSVLGSK